MLAAANIPISKTDQLVGCKAIFAEVSGDWWVHTKAKQPQECYLEREIAIREEKMKAILKDKPMSVITYEMSNANGGFVLNVLAASNGITERSHLELP